MQLEREQRFAGSVRDVVGAQQELLQVLAALILRQSRRFAQQSGCFGQCLRLGATGLATFVSQAESQLHPDGNRMPGQFLEAELAWYACLNGGGKQGLHRYVCLRLRGGALECFRNDVGDRNPGAEQACRDFRHLGIALHLGPVRRNGG